MATKGKKGKDPKSAKGTKQDESSEDKKAETPFSEPQDSVSEEQNVSEEPQLREQTPEPIYEEPILPELIIEL